LKRTTNSEKEKDINLYEAAGHDSIAESQRYQRCLVKQIVKIIDMLVDQLENYVIRSAIVIYLVKINKI